MSTFGELLRDQLPAINNFTNAGINFTLEIRDFLKEKAAIEKEYAHKLEQLSRKYMARKDKLSASIMGDNAPNVIAAASGGGGASAAGSGSVVGVSPDDDKYGTFFKSWVDMLKEVDEMAQLRHKLSEGISAEVTDPIKVVIQRKDDARKRHLVFGQKITDERNRNYAEKDRAKAKYEECCDAVESTRVKMDKAADEKTRDRLRRQLIQDTSEMNNAKNNYLAAVAVANAQKKAFFFEDVPAVMDWLHDLNASRMTATQMLMLDWMKMERELHDGVSTHLQSVTDSLAGINAQSDLELYAKFQTAPWTEPYDFKFEPTLLFAETDELVVDELATVYLTNRLTKLEENLADVEAEVATKLREIEGLQSLYDAYSATPSLGNADEINENIIESRRALMLISDTKLRITTTIGVFQKAVGKGRDGKRHNLAKHNFAIPNTCDYCQEKVWGSALSCKDCGYNCHLKCELKVPPYCKNEKMTKKDRATMAAASPLSAVSSKSSPKVSGADKAPFDSVSAPGIASASEGGTAKCIYDYEAVNADELSMVVGDVLHIITPDDGTGWMKASKNGIEGMVPATYLEMTKSSLSTRASMKAPAASVTAIYDYDALNSDELSFSVGDKITVISRGDDGWWKGSLHGKQGLFPSTYVE